MNLLIGQLLEYARVLVSTLFVPACVAYLLLPRLILHMSN